MIYYSYDGETGEYLDSGEAMLDPLEKELGNEIYLLPANATFIVPPKTKSGKAICFNPSKEIWEYVEDNRGRTVYSKEDLSESTVETLGSISSDYLKTKPKRKNDFQIWSNGSYTYPDLKTLKSTIKSTLDDLYEEKLKEIYPVGEYYVQPGWATIYTNTLVAMQQDYDADGVLDQTYEILVITNSTGSSMKQITVSTIDEFLLYYKEVKKLYKEITEEYHKNMVAITEATTAEELIKLIAAYR